MRQLTADVSLALLMYVLLVQQVGQGFYACLAAFILSCIVIYFDIINA